MRRFLPAAAALLVSCAAGLASAQEEDGPAGADTDEGVQEFAIPRPGEGARPPGARPGGEETAAPRRRRAPRPAGEIPFTLRADLLFLYVWRVTGQIGDLHLNRGDGIDLTKDLDVDRGAARGMLEFEGTFGTAEHPLRVGGTVLEFDMRGEEALPRQNVYALTVLPKGEPTRTWIVLSRMTLEAAVGLYGYQRNDTKDWTMDVVAGAVFWGAEWAIETENFGTLNARLGDLRLYAGLEFHKRLSKVLSVHLRGVLGNPSTFLGGYEAALEARVGRLVGRVEAHVGTPEFGHFGLRARYVLSDSVDVSFAYLQVFEQVMDGGSFFGVSNEGFFRLNHSFFGVGLAIRG